MALVFNDTTARNGLIQWCEDTCGLGATGITSSTATFQQFVRWMNQWNKIGFAYAIMSFKGHDVDDPNYSTAPSGTFTGTTNRDYNLDTSYAMLRFKNVNISYDGTNYYPASPFDDNDRRDLAVNDPNIDTRFDRSAPKYDLISNGFKIFPKFTQAQVDAGAKVYIEFFRAPRDFATSGTDSYTTGFDLPFQHLPAIGASYEYAKLYKPDLLPELRMDIYGGRRDGVLKKGILKEMQEWYSAKQPSNGRMIPMYQNNK